SARRISRICSCSCRLTAIGCLESTTSRWAAICFSATATPFSSNRRSSRIAFGSCPCERDDQKLKGGSNDRTLGEATPDRACSVSLPHPDIEPIEGDGFAHRLQSRRGITVFPTTRVPDVPEQMSGQRLVQCTQLSAAETHLISKSLKTFL